MNTKFTMSREPILSIRLDQHDHVMSEGSGFQCARCGAPAGYRVTVFDGSADEPTTLELDVCHEHSRQGINDALDELGIVWNLVEVLDG